MNNDSQVGFQLKGPWAVAAVIAIVLLGGGYMLVYKLDSLKSLVQENAYDANLPAETVKEKTEGPIRMELQRIYREKYLAKLVESPDRLKPEVAQKIIEINRAIDSLEFRNVTIKKRAIHTEGNDVTLLVTVDYTMTPPLDNTTTRTFNVEAKSNGKGSWQFYGER
jgi:SMC interacting uncharacterized protein involved in chromosome segregation